MKFFSVFLMLSQETITSKLKATFCLVTLLKVSAGMICTSTGMGLQINPILQAAPTGNTNPTTAMANTMYFPVPESISGHTSIPVETSTNTRLR
jgi:hypothetical protein